MNGKTESSDAQDRELKYYKRRVDELAGANLQLDYRMSGFQHELRQKRQGFALLSELHQLIGVNSEVTEIFSNAIESINTTLGMDKTVVLTSSQQDHKFTASQWAGFHAREVEVFQDVELTFPKEFADGSGLLLVTKSTSPTPFIDSVRTAFDLPFFLCIPVMVEDASIGILLTGRMKEARPLNQPLDAGDIDTLQAIAGLVSASVRNLRLAVFREMDKLKTEFFANISHEFRTPLTLTLGPIEALLAGRYGSIDEEVAAQLLIMRRNQERLLALINEILDLSKLETGGMKLKVSRRPDINELIRQQVAHFEATTSHRGLELKVSLDPVLENMEVYVDWLQFEKVTANLLSNALKFTEHGSISIASESKDEAFILTVSDTGIGIKQDQLPHIFDRFRQADGSESRHHSGTGIGLALAKEVVELHGGSITAQSQPGRGSVFRVRVPLGRAHLDPACVVDFVESASADGPRQIPADHAYDIGSDNGDVETLNAESQVNFDDSKPTLLYAEDNPDLRGHMRDLLSPEYNIFLASDGNDGLEQARALRPDLILTDQMMPNMSGRDLLRAIRNDEELSHTPIIFLTARAGTEARVDSLEAGADDYIAKPFHATEVLARIHGQLRAREQERELSRLNSRLTATVERQMSELVRTGELKRFLSPSVVETVLGGKTESQRCRVTILFADLVSFTSLSEELEPEELIALLNEFIREMTAVSIDHEGTVMSFSGDGLMVVYGAPKPMEDADQAWAAISSALGMRRQMGELSARWRRRGIIQELQVRIGINTGYCTVGIVGSELMQTYTVHGPPVNIAARLMAGAEPGSIVSGWSTLAFVENFVSSRSLGAIELRGVTRPVEAHEILAANGEPTNDLGPMIQPPGNRPSTA